MAAAAEHVLLSRFLDEQRRAVVTSLAGVPAALLREPLVLPDASLLALVDHLTRLERWWFAYTFAGMDDSSGGRPDRSKSPAHIVRRYCTECDRSRALVAGVSLDQLAVRSTPDGAAVSLRWILVHMTAETARHLGHAVILRRLIDGATGPPWADSV